MESTPPKSNNYTESELEFMTVFSSVLETSYDLFLLCGSNFGHNKEVLTRVKLLLLKTDADPYETFDGENSYDVAASCGYTRICALIRKYKPCANGHFMGLVTVKPVSL